MQLRTSTSRITGKERDAESGLDDFGARYYSSNVGRFTIPDWSGKASSVPYAEFSDPQSLNLYTYVRNNPITRFDADGHFAEDFFRGLMEQALPIDLKKKEKKQQKPVPTYTLKVVTSEGKIQEIKIPVGSKVLTMSQKPGTDELSGAKSMTVTYQVSNVNTKGLSKETNPTEVTMTETLNRGSNCSSGCSNTTVPESYRAAQFTDYITTGNGASFTSREQYFIGGSNTPATLLRPIGSTGTWDMGTAAVVTATRDAVPSVSLEP